MVLRRLDSERYLLIFNKTRRRYWGTNLHPGIKGISLGFVKVFFRPKYDLVCLTSNQFRFLLLRFA